ncbi:MAG: T9SS type A sorting domain-containing protein [Bacteroidales bacterium]|nr:T9SS type A sorting domain-containing protein [Bacteroidales bacterium]
MKKQSALVLLILSFVYNAFGQSFGAHHIVTSGSLPVSVKSIEVLDLNQDGELDILANGNGNKIYYLENKGGQEFKVLQELTEVYNFELNETKFSDINNDGLIDIVYSRYDYWDQLAWLINTGDNRFIFAESIFNLTQAGWETVSFSLADLNGDNIDDVVIGCNENDYNLQFRINNGEGTFGPLVSLINDGKLAAYQCIDFDNDEDIDIIYSSKNPYRLVASINNGNGGFTEEVIIDTNALNPAHGFQSFDSDGDNDVDIMAFSNDTISLFRNDGGNAFTRIILTNDSTFHAYNGIIIRTLDIDNDGDLDLINNFFEILENAGNNDFQYKKDENFPFYTSCLEVTDLNKNADEDIIYEYGDGGIRYIEDATFENLPYGKTITSQVNRPKYPAYQKINDDEFPDICIFDYYSNFVFYLNNGHGEFPDTITTEMLHVYAGHVAFFDIDKDGFCDIASYGDHEYDGFSDSSNFKLARNNGDNTFTTFYVDDFNDLKNRLTLFLDYNNDGLLNAIALDQSYIGTDTILLFNVNQDYTISCYDTISFTSPIEIENLKFYDVDQNGQNDIMFNDDGKLYIVYSFDGRFENQLDIVLFSAERILDFETANLDNDSIKELLITTGNNLTVMEDFNGSPPANSYVLQIDDYPRRLIAADMNNDGIDEVICISYDKINLLKNIQNDSFEKEDYDYFQYPPSGLTLPFVFSDIDSDGDDDLLCTYHLESDISWFENAYLDAHYTPFPEDAAVWTEQNAIVEGDPPQTWTSLYATESDTFLLDHSYTNIYEYYLNPATFDTIRQLYASIRQDIQEKKVFVIRHYLSENNERLLLDFKANVGDTVVLDAYYWDSDPLSTDSIFVVDSISTTTLNNGKETNVFYLSNHKTPFPVTQTLIEGVGSIANPFGPVTDLVNKKPSAFGEFCCPDYLLCLSINDEAVYVLNNETSCKQLEVWTSVQSYDQDAEFEVYPNPAKDKLNIKLSEKPSTNYEVILYNNLGMKVSHIISDKNSDRQTLNIGGLEPGVYHITLKTGKGFYSSKFIKMK